MKDGEQELARAGYAWEIADAPLLHEPLTLADIAHVLELSRLGAIPEKEAGVLLVELLLMLDSSEGAVSYQPEFGEMYSSREHHLAARVGDSAGWLHLGRTRREAMRIAYRILVRRQVLELIGSACTLAETMCEVAGQHVDTVMPDYTYLQPAEPTTFGHYLASFVDPVLRDAGRLEREFGYVNASPMGCGAASGSALLRERELPGRDIGFDGPIHHVRDAMWQSDPFTHSLLAATTLVTTQDKLAEDLEIFTSQEFDFVALGDGLVRPSVLMPQKRNPYALTVIRGLTGILIGRATGQLSLAKSPSARSDLYIHAYGEVPRALGLAIQATDLMAAVLRTLRVNRENMGSGLQGRHTEATDAAVFLTQTCDIDYRTAHAIVSRAVLESGSDEGPVSAHDIVAAALVVSGRTLDISEEQLRSATDPTRVVAGHDGLGGSAPSAMTEFIADRLTRARELSTWVQETGDRLRVGETGIVQRARTQVDTYGEREST